MRLYLWNYSINHNKNETEKNHIDTTLTDLVLDIDTNIVNIKGVSVWCLYIYIMLICKGINIWSSVHEKVTQHWGWVEKMRFLLKKCVGIECLIMPINRKLWRCKIYVKYLVLFTSYLTANLSIITCRKLCLSACKKLTSSVTSLLRYC